MPQQGVVPRRVHHAEIADHPRADSFVRRDVSAAAPLARDRLGGIQCRCEDEREFARLPDPEGRVPASLDDAVAAVCTQGFCDGFQGPSVGFDDGFAVTLKFGWKGVSVADHGDDGVATRRQSGDAGATETAVGADDEDSHCATLLPSGFSLFPECERLAMLKLE